MVLRRIFAGGGLGLRVLLVPGPGATALRLEAEAAVRQLGGRVAASPAGADVLLETGTLSGALREAADELWRQVPGPRARLSVTVEGRVKDTLRSASTHLHARTDEAHAGGEGGPGGGQGDEGEMEMPAGLPMADRGEDRDGLTLDVLHVPLGPFLPYWPAGVVIDTELQGDVIQRATARGMPEAVAPVASPFWQAAHDPASLRVRTAAAHLDSMSRLLAVVGWRSAAAVACALRDGLVHGSDVAAVHEKFTRWRPRVERSRFLRAQTTGVGVFTASDAADFGVSGPAARAGEPWDGTARWQRWLVETDDLLGGRRPAPDEGPRGRLDHSDPPSCGLLAAVTALLPGLELSTARVLVATLDPDPEELTQLSRGKAA